MLEISDTSREIVKTEVHIKTSSAYIVCLNLIWYTVVVVFWCLQFCLNGSSCVVSICFADVGSNDDILAHLGVVFNIAMSSLSIDLC